MNLSQPVYLLKSKAKELKKAKNLSMYSALNLVAREEGFSSWSLLMSKQVDFLPKKFSDILEYFNNGDIIAIAARPSVGKTSFALNIMLFSLKRENKDCFFFSLSEIDRDIKSRISSFLKENDINTENLYFNYSNDISADYILEKVSERVEEGSVIVVDYLQLLDQKRVNDSLDIQLQKLKQFAKDKRCKIIFISQISREFENKSTFVPSIDDIKMPNPFNLNLINKILFLHKDIESKRVVVTFCKQKHSFKVNFDKEKYLFFN